MTHLPVLLGPALDYLAIRPDGIYLDATFGAGGHSRAILNRLRTGRLISIDADPKAAERAREIDDSRFIFVQANFSQLRRVLNERAIALVDGVLFDLGVSSMQLDDATRGFSFSRNAPLDMRMNPYEGRNAYDILTTASERELADIFLYYGEERAARKIASTIVRRRESGRLPATTAEFAQMIAGIVRRPGRRERVHPATRVFQALRIAVNDELGALREGLSGAIASLRGAGRVVVISFHSLEDRIVKQTFRDDERLDVLTKKPVVPGRDESSENPRSRSAKMRAAQRKAS
jgi:16S rRNA (cytosine1402-N4)-methyltransferase